ncbi:MAG TPA: quinone oxidoreductase [Gemmatimonadales bacterium]|nr:quinone oxidoreductase [Gemmatimonadales bacterium]
MRAIQVGATGGPDVLRPVELPDPVPGATDALVRVTAAGVNFIDVYHRTGRYPLALPFTPGQEGAGVVVAVGAAVADLRPGDRVGWADGLGGYAELAALPAERLVPLPDAVTDRDAATALLQGMTAHYLSHDTCPIEPGDTVLIHAGAGGVGLLLTQLAKRRGARVVATVSTAEKEALSRAAGADEVIRYGESDFVAEVRRLTGGAGVRVVYDSVGRTTFDGSLRCLAPRGMLVLYGGSSGPVPPVDPMELSRHGSVFLTRPTLRHYVADRPALLRRAAQVLDWVTAGTLRLRVHATYPLDEAARAHRELEARATAGKLLLLPVR